ncbi:molybdenum cofactor guanylyltransferase [Chloroflexota bacterium]
MKTSSIILAGGRGLRLGQDKVLETVGNRSLLEQVISCVSSLSTDIVIVTAEERAIPEFRGPIKPGVIKDIFPGKGPLGGIYTGLAASDCFYNLVVACDMPFLNPELLRYMIQNSKGFDIVTPRVGSLVEPLHAVYAKSCLAPMETMIEQGELSVYKLLDLVKVRYIEAEEIDRFDPDHLSLFNINTKTDLEKARKLAIKIANDDKC